MKKNIVKQKASLTEEQSLLKLPKLIQRNVKRKQQIIAYMCESVVAKKKDENSTLCDSNASTSRQKTSLEAIREFTKMSLAISMSRFQERDIFRKIQARGLETLHSQLLNEIMRETKEEYLRVTLHAGMLAKVKPVMDDEEKLYVVEPYKYLGKTKNYKHFLITRKILAKKLILHHPLLRSILNECVLNLPYELINLQIHELKEFKEFELLLSEKVNQCAQSLLQFYNKILLRTNEEIGDHYLEACTGLLSVHISRAIAHTLLHVVNFTNSKEFTPYLKLNISFNDGLILKPAADDVINAYNLFLENLITTGQQLHVLNKTNNKFIYLCLTSEFLQSCKNQIANNIAEFYQPITKYLADLDEQFTRIYSSINTNSFMDSIADIDFQSGCKKIHYYKEYLHKVAYIPENDYFQIGQLVLKRFKESLHDGLQNIVHLIFNRLCAQHFWETNDICESFQLIHMRANQTPKTTEELIETGKYMTWIKDEHLIQLNERVFSSLTLLGEIIQLGILEVEHMETNSNALNWPQKIAPVIELYFGTYEQLKFEAEEKLQKVIEDINVSIKKIEPLLVILDEMDDISKSHLYLKDITLHMGKIKEIHSEIAWINQEELCLSFPKSTYPEFNTLKNYVYPFYHLLKICVNVQRYLFVWQDGQFERVDYKEIRVVVDDFDKELMKMKKDYRKTLREAQDENLPLKFKGTIDDPDILNWPAPLKLCAKAIQLMDAFKPCINVIKIMCNNALRQRHWKAMSEIAGFDVTPNAGTTLRKIMQTDLKSDWSQYEIISIGATKEKQLKDNLISLENEWKLITFNLSKFKTTDMFVIIQLEDIEAVTDDQTTKIIDMRGSVFVQPHETDVMCLFNQILTVRKTIEGWHEIQSHWTQLLPLFQWEHITKLLPQEYVSFNNVIEFHNSYIRTIQENSNVMEIVRNTDILKDITTYLKIIEEVQANVNSYLENVRNNFQRFYFLSDNELFCILSKCKYFNKIQKHFRKIFPGIQTLLLEDSNRIMGMVSAVGEKVDFCNEINIETLSGYPEEWLKLVEKEMRLSVQHQIHECLKVYKKENISMLIKNFSQQAIQVVQQIYFTETIESSLSNKKIMKLRIYLQQLNKSMMEKIELIRSNVLNNLDKFIMKSLIIQTANNINVLKALIENSDNNFIWQTQMKYSFENRICIAQMMQVTVNYLYEYLGNIEQIIITPLTDRCFRILINSYYLQLNGLLRGATETGKTMTIKNLAKAFAVLFLTFNCSQDLNYQIIGKFFKGLAHCGAWLCLKNFHKIQATVLSVIAEDVSTILSAIKSNLDVFHLKGSEIKLSPTCFVCATTDSYSSFLTENLKMSFRIITTPLPDMRIISESQLHSYGFQETRLLSKKLVATFHLLNDMLSEHSDSFGIRAVKSVLKEVENCATKHPQLSEANLVAKSIKTIITPQLSSNDIHTFQTILANVFEEASLHPETIDIQEAINKVCTKSNLATKQTFISKVIQTYELLTIRNGQILIGNTCTGKTTTIKICADLFSQTTPVNYQILNPKCFTYNQLFGYMDDQFKWNDGILTKIFRNNGRRNANQIQWILFDEIIHAEWIENINCILEDNKRLYLTSGEILELNPSTSVIFETNNLSAFSPATISRCGVIYFEAATLTWQDIFKSWINAHAIFEKYEVIMQLIEWFIPACFDYIKNSCTCICKLISINLVKNVMQLAQMHLDNAISECSNKDEESKNIIVWIQASVLQSGIWGLASTLDSTSRIKFDEFYKQLWKGQNKQYPYPRVLDKLEISIPQEGTIFDYYYVYKQRGSWKYWPDLVKNEKIVESLYMSEYVIPTVETIRYCNLIKNHIKFNYPVLLVGAKTTGKSLIMQDMLINQLDKEKYEGNSINLHPSLNPIQVQKLILSKLHKKKLGHFTSPRNKTSIIFIDDLNLVQPDLQGSFPIIELLRQHLDHKTWYDLNNLNTIYIHNVNFITAMGLPQGIRQDLSPRFLRHFSVFGINEFSEEITLRIYTNILQYTYKKAGFPTDITSIINSLVAATSEVYQMVRKTFKPTLNRCQFIFNLNDFSKIIQGFANMKKETYDANKKIYFKLWLHENLRVFSDRIHQSAEHASMLAIIKSVVEKHFNDEVSDYIENSNVQSIDDIVAESSSILFGNFIDKENKRYEELSMKQLHEVVVSSFNEYNTIFNYKLDLVLFDYALEHLVKICRILDISPNNTLLIGSSGSGRQTLTKLACFMYKIHLFQPIITQHYDFNQWQSDIKHILKHAGGYDQPSALLIREEQIVDEPFLQYIDYVSKSLDLSNFYNLDEKQEILELVRLSAQGGNRNLDITSHAVLLFFNKRCRQNLHIFINLDPSNLRVPFTKYTSFSNCNIIWFNNWPAESLEAIAESWIANVQIESNIKNRLPKIFRYVHNNAEHLPTHQPQLISSHCYLHFIKLFITIIKQKQENITLSKNKFMLGLNKLSIAADQISNMQTALAEYQPQLAAMTLRASEMTKEIALETIEVEKASALVRQDEKIASEQAAVAQVLKLECEADLAQAIPILEDAISALNTLKPSDITLVKSMKNPPDAIKLVMAAVCVIKDVKPDRIPDPSTGRKTLDYWGPSKRILGDMNFLQTLKDFDKDHIKPEIMVKIRKEYLPHKDFKPHVVAKASSAAEGLCKWIIAMDMYDKVAKEVAPKKEKLEKAEREYAATMSILNQKKEEVARIEEKLAALNALLDDARKKQEKLQLEVDLCNKKLRKAQKLIGGLSGEKQKWTQTAESLQNEFNSLVGDVIISSGFIAYLASFTNSLRQSTLADWLHHIKSNSIPCSDSFDFIKTLSSDAEVQYWVMNSLPNDQYFIANGIIQNHSQICSIFIDPQYQGSRWISIIEKKNNLTNIKFSDINYLAKIKQNIIRGDSVLVEILNNEIPICIYDLLNKNVYRINNEHYINLNNEQLFYNPNFKLYIVTRKYNACFKPEICKLTTIINFQITEQSLHAILLKIVVEIEKPKFKKLQHVFYIENSKNIKALLELDEKILNTLLTSEIDILEDEEAIEILDKSKDLARNIRQKQEDAKDQERAIAQYKLNYIEFAQHAAKLYFCVNELQNLNFMYQFSLNWYINLYFTSILNAEKYQCYQKRCECLIKSFTFDLYKSVNKSLFAKHKIIFSFQMCTNILLLKNEIEQEQYDMFVRGSSLIDLPNKIIENPMKHVISDQLWQQFSGIEKLPKFNNFIEIFVRNVDYFSDILNRDIFEEKLPDDLLHISTFQILIILRFIKSPFLYTNIIRFIEQTLGKEFTYPPKYNTNDVFIKSYSLSPVLFILSPKVNPVDKIQKFAKEKQLLNKFRSMPLVADRELYTFNLIENAQREGGWLLLENCHLAPKLLQKLTEKMQTFNTSDTHENFRLWLTTETTSDFPVTLLQDSIKIIDETPTNLKDHLLKLYQEDPLVNKDFFNSCPGKQEIFTKALFAFSYFHAMLEERQKYAIFNLPCSINKSNFNNCVLQIRQIVNETNFDIKNICNYILFCNYSEFIADQWDERLFITLIDNCVKGVDLKHYSLPVKNDYQDYLKHIIKLPNYDLPEMLGFDDNLNRLHWRKLNFSTFAALRHLNDTVTEQHEQDGILNRITDVLNNLPTEFTQDLLNCNNSVICKELLHLNELIRLIKESLLSIQNAFNGTLEMTEKLYEDGYRIFNNKLPHNLHIDSPFKTNLSRFIKDLQDKITYFSNVDVEKTNSYWLAAFHFPKALLCNLKLNYCHKYNKSFEEVIVDFDTVINKKDSDYFIITGLFLIGARWNKVEQCLDELGPNRLFDKMEPIVCKIVVNNKHLKNADCNFNCPVYKRDLYEKSNYIVSVLLKTTINQTFWIKRGVSLVCQICNNSFS